MTSCSDYQKCKESNKCKRAVSILSNDDYATFYEQAMRNDKICTMFIDKNTERRTDKEV